nr:type II toxin-antitoxin system Phd/YefM family antitoxin [Teredinibacter turnerae]
MTDFSWKPAEHIKRLMESKRPEILTVNGKAAVVVQDAETYERIAALAEYAESIQNIRQALSEEGRPLDHVTFVFRDISIPCFLWRLKLHFHLILRKLKSQRRLNPCTYLSHKIIQHFIPKIRVHLFYHQRLLNLHAHIVIVNILR